MTSTLSRIIGVFLVAFPLTSVYAKGPTVNVITWWGYLNYPELLHPIEQACNATISFDEYYSDQEFLSRVNKVPYDIAIYSNASLKTFFNQVKPANVDIKTGLVGNYQKDILKAYQSESIPANTVYFQLSLIGFLWNPRNVTLEKSDSIETIFAKAKGKTIVLPDEPLQVLKLLSNTKYAGNPKKANEIPIPSVDGINQLTDGTKIVTAVSLGEIYKNPNFAFAYSWSGEAMDKVINNSLDYRFLIHPQLSHWATDVLTLITRKPAAECVAEKLGGATFLNTLSANHSYYFSPYINSTTSGSKDYQDMSKDFYTSVDHLQKTPNISEAEYNRLSQEWRRIKSAALRKHM